MGIVGGGEVALKVHMPVLLAADRVRIAYVADVSEDAVRRARRMYRVPAHVAGTPAALDGLGPVDACLVSVPVGARMPYYEHLSERGIAVYAEKPVTTTSAGLRRLDELYSRERFACGMQRRFYANVGLIVEAVRSGWFGRLRGVDVREGARTTATGVDWSFRDRPELSGGGILMDLGIHALDLLQMLVPEEDARVLDQEIVFDEGIDRDVRLALGLGDVEARVELSWLRPIGTSLRVRFDACSLVTSAAPSGEVRLVDAHGALRSTLTATAGATTLPGAVARAWDSFLGREAAGMLALDLDSLAPTVELIERVYAAEVVR